MRSETGKGLQRSGKERTMAVNFLYYLSDERHEPALDKKQGLDLVRPYRVRKSRLRWDIV